MSHLLIILILLPILASLAIFAGAPARFTALLATAGNLLIGLFVCFQFDRAVEGYQMASSYQIVANPSINFALGVDGLSVVMLLLSVLVSLCAIWMSPEVKEQARLYFVSLLLISVGAIGAFLSTDVFFFYAFHELALIPTFLMIGIWGKGPEAKQAAWKITIYLALGSIILLIGLLALQLQLSEGGLTFGFVELQERANAGALDAGIQKWIYLTLLVGFGILISLFPFHSWAAPAYAAAPTPTTMLHAGILKKFGLYGLLRFTPMLPEGFEAWRQLLMVLLLGNILFVGFVTLAQKRLDLMLANSSVMHMGYIFLGIASYGMVEGQALGFTGAVILMFAHGVSIALLFGLSGKLEEKLGTLEFSRMGGLGKTAPAFAFLFGLGAFASIGLPGFANFSGEILVFFGGFSGFDAAQRLSPLQITTILSIWGVVISAVYMLRAYRSIFMGDPGEGGSSLPDFTIAQRIPVGLLVLALLIVGFYPNLISQLLPF